MNESPGKSAVVAAAAVVLVAGLVAFGFGYWRISSAHDDAWEGVTSWSPPASETSMALEERNRVVSGAVAALLGIGLSVVGANRLLKSLPRR